MRRLLSVSLPAVIEVSSAAASTMTLTGAPGSYTLSTSSGFITFDGDISTVSGWQNLTLIETGTAQVAFNSTEHLAALSLSGDSVAEVANGGTRALVLGSLSLSGTAVLDLADDSMIVQNGGAAGEASVQGWLHNGFAGGTWVGTSGSPSILSSVAQAANYYAGINQNSLGYALNSELGSPFQSFAGQTVNQNDVLVVFTVTATENADFDGTVATFTDADPLALLIGYTANVDWGDGSQSTGTITDSGGTLAVTADHTFDASGDYPVTVDVSDSNGNDGYADEDATVADAIPDPPTNLVAQANGGTEIDLTWDDSDLATGYNILRSTDNINFTQIDTTGDGVNFYNDTNLGSGLSGHTPYYYQVQATNDAGASASSDTASATTADNAPIAVDDGPADPSADNPYTVSHNSTIDIPVLANDTDPDGDALTIASAQVAAGSQGSVQVVTVGGQQELQYTPGSGASAIGVNQITYTASDGTLTSNTATVTVNVTNALPVVTGGLFFDPYDGTGIASGTVQATDADGDPLTYSVVQQPNNGTFTLNQTTGAFTYDTNGPEDDSGDVSNDTVVVKANDGIGDSNEASLTFVASACVPNSGDPSGYSFIDVANSTAGPILSGQTLSGTVPMGDSDYSAQANLVTDDPGNPAAAGRTLTLNSDGTYTYTPPAGFSGTDWFTYYLSDDNGDQSNYATVFITVKPVKTALVWGDESVPAESSYTENMNVDNDIDASGNPDDQESQPPAGDQELSPLNLKVNTEGLTLPNGSTETLSITSGDTYASVWVLNGATYTQILGAGVADSKTWTIKSSDTNPADQMPATVYAQGINTGTAQFNLNVTVAGDTEGSDFSPDERPEGIDATANIVSPSLSVFYTATGMTSQEVTAVTPPGKNPVETAYIPVSWDDENYVVASPNATPKDATEAKLVSDDDKDTNGKTAIDASPPGNNTNTANVGDLDLVHVVLNGLATAPGNNKGLYKIGGTAVSMTPGSHNGLFAFYNNKDKTGALNLLNASFIPDEDSQIDIWVESKGMSSTVGAFTLQVINVKHPAKPYGTVISLEPYEAVGPQNVPGFSTYTYTAAVPPDVTAPIWSGNGGDSTANVVKPGLHVNASCDVSFDAGAKVEYVDFSPATGFTYQLPVNVVNVKYARNTNNTPEISLSGRSVARTAGENQTSPVNLDSSPAGNPAMSADVIVTLTGPTVDNQMRGVRFIDVGIMQEVDTVTRQETPQGPGGQTLNGPDATSRNPKMYAKLDTFPPGPNAPNVGPWYESTTGLLQGYSAFSDWPKPSDPTTHIPPNTTAVDRTLTHEPTATDRPFGQTIIPAGVGGIVNVTFEMDFTVFLAAHTIDSIPAGFAASGTAPGNLYFSEAQAAWAFKGTGTVTNGVWKGAAQANNVPGAGVYFGNDNGNTAEDLAPSTAATDAILGSLSGTSQSYNEWVGTLNSLKVQSNWK